MLELSSLADFSIETWHRFWKGSAEFLVLLPEAARGSPAELENWLAPQSPRSSVLAVVPDRAADGESHSLWGTLPPVLAALLSPPAVGQPVILSRKLAESSGGMSALSDLATPDSSVSDRIRLWKGLIALTSAGATVSCLAPFLEAEPTNNRAGFEWEIPLQALAPDRPGKSSQWILNQLLSARDGDLLPALPGLKRSISWTALLAGLFQWHDYLEESHSLSQSIEGQGPDQLGDCWHAVMHRREPDYGNAKYWCGQMGRPAFYRQLPIIARTLLEQFPEGEARTWSDRLAGSRGWDLYAFVDFCQLGAARPESALAETARRIQRAEMVLLLQASYAAASK